MSGSCCSVVARADPAFTLFFRDTWATTNDGGPAARTAALLVEAPTQANARASHARAGASAPQLLHCCVPPSSLSRWEEEPAAASREERPSATNADLRRSVRAGEQPSGESPTRAAKPASGKGLLLRFSSQWLAGRCFPLSALCVVLARALAPLAPLPAAPFCALSVRPDGGWAILTPSPPFLCVCTCFLYILFVFRFPNTQPDVSARGKDSNFNELELGFSPRASCEVGRNRCQG